MKPITVVSLFDGISSGMMALKRAEIAVCEYYASEISEVAIKQSVDNFPDIKQVGDVRGWRDWGIDWSLVDLILSGSPCKGFSLAGRQAGFCDEYSNLFQYFIEIRDHALEANPKCKFLMENVNMKIEYLNTLSDIVGVQPININSNTLSAQNRNRFYWSNIDGITQPAPLSIMLEDIVDVWDCKYNLKTPIEGIDFRGTSKTSLYPNRRIWCAASRGRTIDGVYGQRMEINGSGRSNALTTVQKDNHVVMVESGSVIGVRKLTGNECRKLQTIPDYYRFSCSENQQIKLCGHGWTIDVIAHILSFMK